ncbi:MAG: ABC transporter permease [Lachnospiraceae bacterium]|nr:ABC transporter permease [Lachnospiraceae bacterium]
MKLKMWMQNRIQRGQLILIRSLTRGRIILGITGIISFIIFLILSGVSGVLADRQETQSMAGRWAGDGEKDVAQISCFFAQSARFSQDSVMSFEHRLDSALVEASITNDSENPGARLWASAYSATGSITLTSSRASVTVNAIGIGGDFFLFHPLELLTGSFFSGNDVMKDYCVIDEETAWQLFGSNDVAGQMITIADVPHVVTGVIRRETGRLPEAAGLDTSVAYVSYETLSQYGQADQIGCYELVMPNPVDKYALNYVKENIGVQERELEALENTSRYELPALLQVVGAFGTRSMNGKAIIYPYWENIARGYEDILALIMIIRALFLLYPVILIAAVLFISWKHRTWNSKTVYLYLKDKGERSMEKLRAARQRKGTRSEEDGEKPRKKRKEKPEKPGKERKEKKEKSRQNRKKNGKETGEDYEEQEEMD